MRFRIIVAKANNRSEVLDGVATAFALSNCSKEEMDLWIFRFRAAQLSRNVFCTLSVAVAMILPGNCDSILVNHRLGICKRFLGRAEGNRLTCGKSFWRFRYRRRKRKLWHRRVWVLEARG